MPTIGNINQPADQSIAGALRSLNGLQPHSVWAHFATLCAIPRASLHEATLREHLAEWAKTHKLAAIVDDAGNLILRKPASTGCEAMPGVILQGHLDMVCQANAGTQHDFERDPIRAVVRDGWVVAENTTLGADNGIGVALALAALEEPDLIHPPLEVLLTVNEESGMDGARGLSPGALQGKILINLDTEEWGHFYLGCAGGVDVEVRHTCEQQDLPPNYLIWQLSVSGLRGGHSGIDIHLGRGNAIKLLAEALHDLSGCTDLRLIDLNGGTARNAIPREAFALFAAPAADTAQLADRVKLHLQVWQQRFAEADPDVAFSIKEENANSGKVISRPEQERLLDFLNGAANGVAQTSDTFPGVTDTSANLGVAGLKQGIFNATFKLRSLHDDRADTLAESLLAHAATHGLQAWKDGAYPCWTPDPASNLLALCQHAHITQFGQRASTQVIHAGLECGLLSASHPHLEMISFGPDIRGAHAPGERVEIASVERCWLLLKAVLRALAKS